MTCVNARDTITQADGTALGNYQIEDAVELSFGGHLQARVTSHCRVDAGMWVAWIQGVEGDGIDAYGTSAYGDDQTKADWPSLIASSTVYSVGYFPDDGSPATIYELGIDPIYYWNDVGRRVPSDHCAHYPLVGDSYANNGKSQLTGWSMAPLDLQIRTDGTNVWVISLAQESVKHPYLYNAPGEIDDCDNTHPSFNDYWGAGHSDPFVHDDDFQALTPDDIWWIYETKPFGGDAPFGTPYDYAGWTHSFRWQPARVTVWWGDIGGFTMLDTVEAQFNNRDGYCSGIECAASPAEPGVLHVLWAEGGEGQIAPIHQRGQRINYSRWDTSGKTIDTDVLYTLEDGDGQTVSDDVFIWTGEMILRNDHGSPTAIVWPWVCAGGPQFVSTTAEYWDLSGATANVVQVLNPSLVPTTAETFLVEDVIVAGSVAGSSGYMPGGIKGGVGGYNARQQYASSLYTDQLDSDEDVYIVQATYTTTDSGTPLSLGFYRIRADGSQTFEFMDGVRTVWYSIIPNNTSGIAVSEWQHDFVSDPDNVWVPDGTNVVHLDRQCFRQWELLPAFPESTDPLRSGFLTGEFDAPTSPPPLVTFDDGDWLLGGGYGPQIIAFAFDPSYIASLKARVCRCCLPCLNHIGLHIWEKAGGPTG